MSDETTKDGRNEKHARKEPDARTEPHTPNPPHTTKHGVTAPKFGSAGSGGAELEPGPERD